MAAVVNSVDIGDIDISQGSVATRLRCGGTLSELFVWCHAGMTYVLGNIS